MSFMSDLAEKIAPYFAAIYDGSKSVGDSLKLEGESKDEVIAKSAGKNMPYSGFLKLGNFSSLFSIESNVITFESMRVSVNGRVFDIGGSVDLGDAPLANIRYDVVMVAEDGTLELSTQTTYGGFVVYTDEGKGLYSKDGIYYVPLCKIRRLNQAL